jgi:REP element-mobilizing transposase RayT
MERIARVVADGIPHHITQRGNRRQKTLLSDEDYAAYIYCMAPWCREYAVDIRIYCLMPNHGHLISVPSKKNITVWPSMKRTADTPAASTFVKDAGGISGRSNLLLW